MTQSDTGTTLVKLRKMIESMQKEEMRQIQSTHADALSQIVSIAKQNQLNAEHIAFALSVRQPKEKKIRVPRKNKKSSVFIEPEVVQ
jgi:TusA-related sulfurtransferase